MTTEEKAKAYDEALERAQKATRAGSDVAMDIVQYIFPELAESEDERIRKDIRLVVESSATKYFKETGQMPEWYDRSVAWLEKQKEQKPKEDIIGKAISYFGAESLLDNANGLSDFEKFTAWLYCEFLRGLPKKLNQEYIKEQTKVIFDAAQKELCKMPDSTKLLKMWDAEKDMLQEKDFRGDTWRIAQKAFMDGFARGTCVKFEKQKEQKPVETSDFKTKLAEYLQNNSPKDGQYVISSESILEMAKEELLKRGVVQKPVEYLPKQKVFDIMTKLTNLSYSERIPIDSEEYVKIHEITSDVNSLLDYPIKPAEWSEEDKDYYDTIVRKLEVISDDSGLSDNQIKFLREHCPLNCSDWSEEDEKDMAHIIRILDDCYAYGKHDLSKTDHENLVNKLKSLRPSWKPSEVCYGAKGDPDPAGEEQEEPEYSAF